MPEIHVSPGVYTQTVDETHLPQAAGGAVGAALIGLAGKGPAYVPTRISNMGEFRSVFGDLNPNYYMPYAARAYLRHSNTLDVVRVLGRAGASVGDSVLLSFPTGGVTSEAQAIDSTILGVLRFRGSLTDVAISGVPTNFAIEIPGSSTAGGLSMRESDGGYIKKVLGTDPTQIKSGDAITTLYVDAAFDYQESAITGTVSSTNLFATATATFNNVTGGFAAGSTPLVVSQNFGGSVYDLFQVHTLSHGNAANSEIKISVTQVDVSATAYPEFSIIVRQYNDTDTNPIVLEMFNSVSMDPSAKNYIARVIGDRRVSQTLTTDPPTILYDGDYENMSNYIRVVVYPGYPVAARPSGFKGVSAFYPTPIIPSLPTRTNHLNAQSSADFTVFPGINFDQGGVTDRLKKTITSASGSSTADDGMLFFSVTSDLAGSGGLTNYTLVNQVGSTSGNYTATNSLRFTVPVFGGWDGFDPRSDLLTDLNDGTLSADIRVAMNTLADPEEVDFNLIATPGIHSAGIGNIPSQVITMIEERGDAFYILDISNGTGTGTALSMTVAQAQTEADKYDSSFAATYYPWIRIQDIDSDSLVWVPPSVEILSVYAFNDRVRQPWWAPAGFNRGGLENVAEARRRLNTTQRDDLQTHNINPIATFPGQGIVVWGQRTLQKKASLLDRVNVRRMLIEVQKTIAGFSRVFVFEQSGVALMTKLSAIINNYLADVKAENGLQDFRAIIDETTTTPDLVDRNIVKGQIVLRPTSAAEMILLDFNVTRSGAVFSE